MQILDDLASLRAENARLILVLTERTEHIDAILRCFECGTSASVATGRWGIGLRKATD